MSVAAERVDPGALLDIIHRMPVGVITFRTDGTIEMVNPTARQTLMPVLRQTDLDNVYVSLKGLCPELADKVAAFTDSAGTVIDQRQIDTRSGQQAVTLSLTVTRVRVNLYMAVFKDITRLTEMLAYAFASADLLLDLDTDGTIRWAGGALRTLLNMGPRDVIGEPVTTLISPRDRDTMTKAMALIAARGRLAPVMLRLANPRQTRCVISGLTQEGGGRRYLLTVGPPPATDVAPEPTLRGGKDFGMEVEGWARNGQAGTLGLVDIKNWDQTAAKLDETQLGCLKHMIGRVAAEAVGEDMVLGEIGDGRFGVLGQTDTDLTRLGSALQELVGSFSAERDARVETAGLNLDAGLLTLGQSVQALRLVLSRFGTGGTEGVAQSGLADGLAGIIEVASGQKRTLAAAIAQNRFTLMYQPVVGLADRHLHHYEALIRPAKDGGAMNPQEFVTMIEAVGLSHELDLAVLRMALAAVRQTRASVAVNVSGLSIVDPAFTDAVLKEATGVPPGLLLIELTETAEVQDLSAAAAQIKRLRAAHIAVCLDDFGSGSASFRYVRDLEVDYVKIDGSFVQAAGRSDQGRSFVCAMRDLAKSAGAKTIAEMIETEAEAALMQELGVDHGQGYLFGKAGPIAVAAPIRVGSLPSRWWG